MQPGNSKKIWNFFVTTFRNNVQFALTNASLTCDFFSLPSGVVRHAPSSSGITRCLATRPRYSACRLRFCKAKCDYNPSSFVFVSILLFALQALCPVTIQSQRAKFVYVRVDFRSVRIWWVEIRGVGLVSSSSRLIK